MRKFFIQNEYGEQIPLQGGSVFLWQPSGFGASDSITYGCADGFFIRTHREIAQTEKSGRLLFLPGSPYADYRKFADFIYGAKKLTLAYAPENETFYVDVDVTAVEKGELNEYGILETPIVFTPLSPIYTPYNLNLVIQGDGDEGAKRYEYPYPYRYSDSSLSGILDFTAPAQLDSAFRMEIPGEIKAPVLTCKYADTEEIIGRVDLSELTVDEDETLVYTSVPGEAGAYLRKGDTLADITPFLGISKGVPAYFRLPPYVPLRFELTAASLIGVNAKITVYRYFRTV